MSEGHSPSLELLEALLKIHDNIRDTVVAATEKRQTADLANIDRDDEDGDTIYAIDVIGEERLVALLEDIALDHSSLVLVAEGLPGSRLTHCHACCVRAASV